MEFEYAPRRLRTLPSWLLAQVSLRANRVVTEALSESGASRSQYAALASLEEFGPLSQAALSDRTGLDPSDVVRLVDELEVAQYVVRIHDPEDRRRNILTLTPAGRTRLAELDDLIGRAQGDVLHRLGAPERRELVRLLHLLLGGPPEPDRDQRRA